MYSMKDNEGNFFNKFGTINSKFSTDGEIKVGSIVKACFEIKDYKEFKGAKQTSLGRASKLK